MKATVVYLGALGRDHRHPRHAIPPLRAAYATSALRASGHDVELVDTGAPSAPRIPLAERIARRRPDLLVLDARIETVEQIAMAVILALLFRGFRPVPVFDSYTRFAAGALQSYSLPNRPSRVPSPVLGLDSPRTERAIRRASSSNAALSSGTFPSRHTNANRRLTVSVPALRWIARRRSGSGLKGCDGGSVSGIPVRRASHRTWR